MSIFSMQSFHSVKVSHVQRHLTHHALHSATIEEVKEEKRISKQHPKE
jgi:hypothetical protein